MYFIHARNTSNEIPFPFNTFESVSIYYFELYRIKISFSSLRLNTLFFIKNIIYILNEKIMCPTHQFVK